MVWPTCGGKWWASDIQYIHNYLKMGMYISCAYVDVSKICI